MDEFEKRAREWLRGQRYDFDSGTGDFDVEDVATLLRETHNAAVALCAKSARVCDSEGCNGESIARHIECLASPSDAQKGAVGGG